MTPASSTFSSTPCAGSTLSAISAGSSASPTSSTAWSLCSASWSGGSTPALQGRPDNHPPNGVEAALRSDLHPGHRLCRPRRARTHANKDELLLVLDRPDIALHTNG